MVRPRVTKPIERRCRKAVRLVPERTSTPRTGEQREDGARSDVAGVLRTVGQFRPWTSASGLIFVLRTIETFPLVRTEVEHVHIALVARPLPVSQVNDLLHDHRSIPPARKLRVYWFVPIRQ